jgi:H/ACA ribonucleoprotein complex non-core subunit NAF1
MCGPGNQTQWIDQINKFVSSVLHPSMATFKAPQLLPQDLLLISELVDIPQQRPRPSASPKGDSEDDIASSSSDSEEEIEKDLTAPPEDESDA